MYENFNADEIAFGPNGLVPAIAQDADTREVLMLAWMNREALVKTLKTGQAHYYSRSRDRLWLKGETSGHFQQVREIRRDCDSDALLLMVAQTGAACHTGNRSCFYRDLSGEEIQIPDISGTGDALDKLQSVIEDRRAHPREGSYTNYLFEKGIDKILKKVGEESAEIIIAAKNPSRSDLTGEIADMMFHVSVLLSERGLAWRDIAAELERRRKG
ncbi:MAG: bifunctional phosphoribosyl-AMP cyclohydrolase/phosphoribosyl-ATP diphosphatase HisIE [Synergistaceae bacterium]|jgi:phosphoribosyl-ATP pyrophosphohydrolase/phosphoribosyl-AMP cyclohydrolase|nr:bifunctional phosphoribosyl-AMP cyclohydrolase/phosphoribosyl-ATP diphosphatase HisIE [Synergistaceae bacterium]